MKQFIFYLFFLLVLFSCANNPQSPAGAVVESEQPTLPIRDFIKKFRIIQPPFYYLGWMENDRYLRQSFVLKKNSIDTMFYKLPDDDLPVYGYGMLADTSAFYSLIYFETADDNYPVLVTYSKSGQQIGEQGLVVRGCGSDCGLKYCSYTAQIDKNYSIYLADTLHYEGSCNSADHYTPGDSTFIFSKTGVVEKSGMIKLSEEIEQRIGK